MAISFIKDVISSAVASQEEPIDFLKASELEKSLYNFREKVCAEPKDERVLKKNELTEGIGQKIMRDPAHIDLGIHISVAYDKPPHIGGIWNPAYILEPRIETPYPIMGLIHTNNRNDDIRHGLHESGNHVTGGSFFFGISFKFNGIF